MEITFYGTRGSTPIASAGILRYGGNTTCIALRAGHQLLLVDCGTGLIDVYRELFESGLYYEADIFLTHVHWDHIQGFAFFNPFFSPAHTFRFYGEKREGMNIREQLSNAFHPPIFPLRISQFSGNILYNDIVCGDSFMVGEVHVQTFRLTHPDICTGYRFTHEGKSVCIVSDYEHGGEAPLQYAMDADVLVYDAQYTPEEYPSKKSWGHSTWQEGAKFARACGAKRLLLTHHDPARDDHTLNTLQKELQACLPEALFAWDGLTLRV